MLTSKKEIIYDDSNENVEDKQETVIEELPLTQENITADTGIEVASSGKAEEEQEQVLEGQNEGLELGDYVVVTSEGPLFEELYGKIYYIDETQIHILEDGKSRKVFIIPLVEDEESGAPIPDPELQLTGMEIQEKRKLPSFVEQMNIKKGLMAETFTAEGEAVATYAIEDVDEKTDTALFREESGDLLTIPFAFKGIPRDKSVAPFDVLRVVEPLKKEEEEAVPENAGNAQNVDGLEFEFIEDYDVPDAPEVPEEGLEEVRKKPNYLIVYTDDYTKKNSMLQELINQLPEEARRNERRIRSIRRLVENMALLRNDITKYNSSGRAVGLLAVAYKSLFDLLEKTEFPLAKKILAVAKSLYLDHSEEGIAARVLGGQGDPITTTDSSINIQYLQDAIENGELFLDTQFNMGRSSTIVGTGGAPRVPFWISIWQAYFDNYFKTFLPMEEEGDQKDVSHDYDFFRLQIPKTDPPYTLSGLPVTDANRDVYTDISYINKVGYSYMRALGPRYTRYGIAKALQLSESADTVTVLSYLLFPMRFLRDLGYIRSGVLAIDIAYGALPPMTMNMILDMNGPIEDIVDPDKIITVKFDGSSLGNQRIEDWLKGQEFKGKGIGDIQPYLRSFGLAHTELTVPQKTVLDYKVIITIANIKKFLKTMRDSILQQRGALSPIETVSILPSNDQYEAYETMRQENTLKDLIKDFEERYPSYKYSDIALFAFLYVAHQNYLLATLAKRPDVSVESFRVAREVFLQRLRDKMALELKLLAAGEAPQPNPCQHVKDLVRIRKIQDLDDRMKSLVQFLSSYKEKKEDHWFWCKVCHQHLLCEHEYLIIQEYLKPRERQTLHKELILNFSGGLYGGKYICKQCGQPFADLDFDTSLEYNDEGVPLMGRAEIVSDDLLAVEDLEKALIMEYEDEEKIVSKGRDDTLIQKTINKLAILVGVYPTKDSYEKMIARVKNIMATMPNMEQFNAIQKAKKARGQPATDYTIFVNQAMVSLAAAALLIDVQTHVPDYTVRSTLEGCAKPEFVGYPRDTTNVDVGMEYMACAISSVRDKESPWDLTGFQGISNTPKRLSTILFFVKIATKQLAETPEVQQDIVLKKQYLIETFGTEASLDRPKDKIPVGYLPEQVVLPKVQKEAAENPIIPEGATPLQLARAWIYEGHRLAQVYGNYNARSMFSDANCCFSPIMVPNKFWREIGSVPTLDARRPPEGPRGSFLYVHMTPRIVESIFGKVNPDIMYRLFMTTCFRGPRVGLPHEPGYNNICPWCEMTFPSDYRLPPPQKRFASSDKKQAEYDKQYESEITQRQQQDMIALREAGIETVTKTNFEDLLMEVNGRYRIPPLADQRVPLSMVNLRKMLDFQPTPFEDYIQVMSQTVLDMEALPPDATKENFIKAYGPLSVKAQDFLEDIQKRIGEEPTRVLKQLLDQSPQDLAETLRTYFLVPFERVITKMNPSGTLVIPKGYDLSQETIQDIRKAVSLHTDHLANFFKGLDAADQFYVTQKMRTVVDKLSWCIPVFNKILRVNTIPGGAQGLPFLLSAIVAGILAEFIQPNILPEGATHIGVPRSAVTLMAKRPAELLVSCLNKFQKEGLRYTKDQIRLMIQDRIEKEKKEIINFFDKKDPEERRIEKLLMKLGMGRWRVGGTKAIQRYTPEQYRTEQEERRMAGIVDFPAGSDMVNTGQGFDVEQFREDDA